MSRSCEVKVDIYGRGGPYCQGQRGGWTPWLPEWNFTGRSRPWRRRCPPKIRRLLKFGLFQSGTVCNVVSDHTRLEGSLRTLPTTCSTTMRAGIVSPPGKTVERNSGCTVNVYMNDGYPPVFNPRGFTTG